MAYNLVSKILWIFLMKSQTVVFLISVPLLKLDNKIDRLGILNTLDTEQCFYIDDTDASKFDKMTCDIRCRTYQCLITDLADLHNIIRHQTMASLNQLQSSLALTDTALTCDQNSLAINIHQYTMNGNTRCKLYTKPADDLCHEAGSCSFCHECRNIIFNSQIDLFFIELHQIRILYISNDLNSFIGKMLQISGKLKRRSVDLRSLDHDA